MSVIRKTKASNYVIVSKIHPLSASNFCTPEHSAELAKAEEFIGHLAEAHKGINLLISAPGLLDHDLEKTLLKTHKLSPSLFSPASYVPRPRRIKIEYDHQDKDDNGMSGP